MQLRVAKHRVQKTFSKSFPSRSLWRRKHWFKNLPLSLWAGLEEGKHKSTGTVKLRMLISKQNYLWSVCYVMIYFSLIIKHMSTYNCLLKSVVLRQRHWHVSWTCEMPVVDRFHCHATKTKLETVQWKKPRKWNVIKD